MTRSRAGAEGPYGTCSACGATGRDRYRYRPYGRLEPRRPHESGGPDGLKFLHANYPDEPWVCGACRLAEAAAERGHRPGDGAGDRPPG